MTDVRRSMTFPVPAAELWEAICDPALLHEWFAGIVDVDLRPGGALHVDDGAQTRDGVIETVEPGRRLTFTWHDRPAMPATTVELELEPDGDDACTLHVHEWLHELDELDEVAPIVLDERSFPIGFQPPARALARL